MPPRTITEDQYQVLLEKLSDIDLKLAKREYIDTKVLEIDKVLTGNGKWGFVKLRDWAMSLDEDNRYYRRFSVTVLVTNILSLAITAFIWFVKILPLLEKMQKAGL